MLSWDIQSCSWSLCAHHTWEHAIILIRWTWKPMTISNRVVKEWGISVTACPWNWFRINIKASVWGPIVAIVFTHQKAVVFPGPVGWTHTFSWYHNGCGSGWNETDSTWCIVLMNVREWISRNTIIDFIFNTLNHISVWSSSWRRNINWLRNIVRIVW